MGKNFFLNTCKYKTLILGLCPVRKLQSIPRKTTIEKSKFRATIPFRFFPAVYGF